MRTFAVAIFATMLMLAACARVDARDWEWFVRNTNPHIAGCMPTTYYERHGDGVATYRHPIGTWLRFTNCLNGKSVVVQVRDRGPGKRQQALGIHYDLYYTAAKKIALGQHGRFESGWTSVSVISGGMEAEAR